MAPWADKQEDKLVQVAEQIQAKNRSAKVLFYLNSMMDWTQYSLHHDLAQNHKEYWNVNSASGTAVCMRGQPIFNLSIPEMRQKWLGTMTTALNKTFEGRLLFHGVFGDRANPLPIGNFFDPAIPANESTQDGFWKGDAWWKHEKGNKQMTVNDIKSALLEQCISRKLPPFRYDKNQYLIWNEGHADLFVQAQKTANLTSQVVLSNNNDSQVLGRQWEQWTNDDYDDQTIDYSIRNLQNQSKAGKLTLVHTGAQDKPCSENHRLALGLSAFLMGAGDQSYFSCTDGWLLQEGWKRDQRHKEFDYPLGEPLGDASRTELNSSHVKWAREFKSGTKATLVISLTAKNDGEACIQWANEKATPHGCSLA